MNLQMNWRICFREGWFKKYTCFLVLVDLWMVYIQPNRALRLLFQIFTTWPGFPQRAQYWFLPILPPGGKMCSGMIAKCKVQLKVNRKKIVYAPPGKCVRGWIAMELDARVDDFRTNTSYLRQSVSAHLENDDQNCELSKNCPLLLFWPCSKQSDCNASINIQSLSNQKRVRRAGGEFFVDTI